MKKYNRMYNFSNFIKYRKEEELKKELEKELKNSGFNIVEYCEHYFEKQGFTALWLLSESHLAVHSFPENEKIYIELTSCVEQPFLKMKSFIQSLENKVKKEY